MIFFAPASLQHALRQFMAHYHTERNHQGLENRLPQPASVTVLPITLFNADSPSAECSATTIGPQPDENRFSFFGQCAVTYRRYVIHHFCHARPSAQLSGPAARFSSGCINDGSALLPANR
jgi:hypothetical protein